MSHLKVYIYIENEIYVIRESVNGGIINGSTIKYYDIVSKWDKDLHIVEFLVDRDDFTPCFREDDNFSQADIEKLSRSFHYNRARRGYNRHLKELKFALNIIRREAVEKEFSIVSGHAITSPLSQERISLTREDKPNMRDIGNLSAKVTKSTPEGVALMRKYNEILREFLNKRDEIFQELFKRKDS